MSIYELFKAAGQEADVLPLLVLVPVHTLAETLLSFGRTEQMEEWATKVDQVTEQQPEAPRTPQ